MPQASAKKACYAAGLECVGEEGMLQASDVAAKTACCRRRRHAARVEGVGNFLMLACSRYVAARSAVAVDAFGREIRLVRIINDRKDGDERANRDDL